MDFGRVLSSNSTALKMMKVRDLIGDIGKAGTGIVKGVEKTGNDVVQSVEEVFKNLGNADISKSVTFNVGIGTPGLRTNIVTSAECVIIPFHS